MIKLNLIPCSSCKYYKKIVQIDRKNENQYVLCGKIDDNANELLSYNDHNVKCKYYEKDDDL